jgi:hypothetical protein
MNPRQSRGLSRLHFLCNAAYFRTWIGRQGCLPHAPARTPAVLALCLALIGTSVTLSLICRHATGRFSRSYCDSISSARCLERTAHLLLASGRLLMLRYTYVFTALIGLATLSAGGCRSCSSCHDYDPPVANCHCGTCGAPCNGCGSSCGCSQCGCDRGGGPYSPSTPSVAPMNGAYANRQQSGQMQRAKQPAMTNDYSQQ